MCTSTSVISTPGNQRCTLAFRLHGTPSSIFIRGPIFVILKFKRTHLKFSVYGHKQTDRHTHARAQCSHASVGLAQAHPNYRQFAQFMNSIKSYKVVASIQLRRARMERYLYSASVCQLFIYVIPWLAVQFGIWDQLGL